MPLVQIPVGIAPCQVDDFPEKLGKGEDARPFERSCKGSLRLRPASTKVLTDDELMWLKEQKQWAHVGRRMHIVDVKIVTDASARSTAKPKEGGPVEKAMAKTAAEKAKLSKQLPVVAKPEKPAESKPSETKTETDADVTPDESSSSESTESSGSRSSRRRGGRG